MGTHYRDLPCKLSDEEMAEKRDELAAAVKEKALVAQQKKDQASVFRSKLQSLEAGAEKLAREVVSRTSIRPVECETVYDSSAVRVAVVRMDTREVVEVRDMEKEEVERSLREPFVPESSLRHAMDSFQRQIEGSGEEEVEAGTVEDPSERLAERVAPPTAQEEEIVSEAPKSDGLDLTKVKGVGESLAARLFEAGFGEVDTLRGATVEDLVARVKGLNETVALEILSYIEMNYGDLGKAGSSEDILGLG